MALASTILMIRPAAFGINKETAANNFFQTSENLSLPNLQSAVLAEFDTVVQALRNRDIDVLVINDTPEPPKPSAIFPNNWLSTSPSGGVFVYPLFAHNRRPEKREDVLKKLENLFVVKDLQDWSEYEVEGKFLEGTGSMVIDHDNKVIYSCYSPRTDISVLEKFANVNGYRAIVFLATDKKGFPVYHTNVAMALGENFAVLCEEAIEEEWELIAVRQLLESTNHEVVRISKDQMHSFAGNMLQVKSKSGEKFLVLSKTAFDSLTKEQIDNLSVYCTLLPVAVPTIEQAEGGSVRCMMAEIFLERK
jgi:hypothetical protein